MSQRLVASTHCCSPKFVSFGTVPCVWRPAVIFFVFIIFLSCSSALVQSLFFPARVSGMP